MRVRGIRTGGYTSVRRGLHSGPLDTAWDDLPSSVVVRLGPCNLLRGTRVISHRGGDWAKSVPRRFSRVTGKRNHRPLVAFILTFVLCVAFDFTFDAGPHSLWRRGRTIGHAGFGRRHRVRKGRQP